MGEKEKSRLPCIWLVSRFFGDPNILLGVFDAEDPFLNKENIFLNLLPDVGSILSKCNETTTTSDRKSSANLL